MSVDEKKQQIPIKIIELPLSPGVSQDDVVKKIGLPDDSQKLYVPWPKTGFLDGISYSAGVNGYSVEHWKYNKYPNAILRFTAIGNLKDCVVGDWERTSFKKYSLEH